MRPFAGPGILTASGAGSFSGPDTLRAAGDTVSAPVVESPLPGGAADVVRFFLQTVPQWAQIAGAVVGVGVAITVVVLLWRRRAGIREWFRTRGRRLKLALAGSAAVVVLGAAALGGASWNYMQHDNGFCTGCHVMGPAYQRFVESEHDTLSCHDCHRQSIFASVRQLYFWVAERPAEIGPHSPVSTAVCSQCHVTGQPQMWQRIAETAGHRTHLESDSSALKNVQCVTCHGLEVHRFVPVDSTCGQANCHVNQAIGMGKMAQQTSLHCVTCHQFTAEVPKLATRDSASGTLVPGTTQCFSCHEMKQVLVEFDPARDPHAGTCGMCHNPHRQQSVAEAKQSCATAGCHADWRNIPFHSGLRHRNVGRECTLCHQQHAARVDPSDCAGCHQAVRERARGRVKPPLPFDTTRAIGEVSRAPDAEPARPKGKGDAPPHPDP
ncbi:MAG: hypothetical protein HYS40_07170, partial [Gemmatimonadetes bacterium]|nr:hypothetical protein [Gemmatimonadota bacterium]